MVCSQLSLIPFPSFPQQDSLPSGCALYSYSSTSSQVCQGVISSLRATCTNSSCTTDVYISPRGRSQEDLENILALGLGVVRPSPECEAVIVPFLCLYYLRVCSDGNEINYRPSVEDCMEVSTEICPREWAQADNLLRQVGESLPSCEALGNEDAFQCGIIGMITIFAHSGTLLISTLPLTALIIITIASSEYCIMEVDTNTCIKMFWLS